MDEAHGCVARNTTGQRQRSQPTSRRLAGKQWKVVRHPWQAVCANDRELPLTFQIKHGPLESYMREVFVGRCIPPSIPAATICTSEVSGESFQFSIPYRCGLRDGY